MNNFTNLNKFYIATHAMNQSAWLLQIDLVQLTEKSVNMSQRRLLPQTQIYTIYSPMYIAEWLLKI